MKALVVLLVVINIGFAAWQFTRPPAPTHLLAPSDPGIEPLRLLTEVTAASAPAAPARSRNTPQNPPVPPQNPPPKPPVTTDTLPGACYVLGPFVDAQHAAQVAQRMAALGMSSRQRQSENRAGVGYRVLLPPLPSKESALQIGRQLGAEGVTDYQVIIDDNQRNIIALGVYKDRQAAARRQARIAALGYAPRIEARDVITQDYWLDTQETAQPAAGVWDALRADYPQLQRHSRACP